MKKMFFLIVAVILISTGVSLAGETTFPGPTVPNITPAPITQFSDSTLTPEYKDLGGGVYMIRNNKFTEICWRAKDGYLIWNSYIAHRETGEITLIIYKETRTSFGKFIKTGSYAKTFTPTVLSIPLTATTEFRDLGLGVKEAMMGDVRLMEMEDYAVISRTIWRGNGMQTNYIVFNRKTRTTCALNLLPGQSVTLGNLTLGSSDYNAPGSKVKTFLRRA